MSGNQLLLRSREGITFGRAGVGPTLSTNPAVVRKPSLAPSLESYNVSTIALKRASSTDEAR